jgi:alpha-L-rhamnosidase
MDQVDDDMRVTAVVLDALDGFVPSGTPRLSWSTVTTAAGWFQARADIEVTRAGGERLFAVAGPRSTRVPWPDAPLKPRETAAVRVRVIGVDGHVSPWSDPVSVACGALAPGAWTASFISSGYDHPVLLRGGFEAHRRIGRAILYASAFGAVRVHLNGRRIGDRELAPGWTSYQWRVGYDVYDVTDAVRDGANALGVELAGAWLAEAYGFRDSARRFYEGPPRAAVQLELEYDDGSRETVVTDSGWTWARGGTRASGLYRGETCDAREEPEGWSLPSFDGRAWAPVVVDAPRFEPTPRSAPPVRVTEERSPMSTSRAASGATIIDFGQNLVGRLRIAVDLPRGTRVVLRHAEVLIDGELATRPLRNATSTDVYTAAGGEAVWEPWATFHGFRYAEVTVEVPGPEVPGPEGIGPEVPGPVGIGPEGGGSGSTDAPAAGRVDVTAQVLGTDLRRIGGFRTSHTLLQRFHDNVVWGARGNFLSIPADCPQRDERLGWTGDIQVFAPTAAFLLDCDSFLRSWLQDVRHEQQAAGGVVPMVVPAVIPQVPGLFEPIAAWGDVITVLPMALHEAFADLEVLEECYPGMVRWLDVVAGRLTDGLWEDGMQFGDWLDPDAPPEQPGLAKTDADIVATAYLCRSAVLTARTAELLGRDDEAARHRALAQRVRQAFSEAYVTPRGRMSSDSPTAYALAIVFGLVDDDRLPALGRRLRHLVRRSGYAISTGFVGTPIVCEALTRTGHPDAAARLLLATENPSWLYPVTMGATTIWERWDSLLEDGSLNPGQMTSFNHYALGAVADWLHRRVGGISRLSPGYALFEFAPVVAVGLDDAEVWHDCPAGRIEAFWMRAGASVRMGLVVPPNTRAVVRLGDRAAFEVGSGRHEWHVPLIESRETDALGPPGAAAPAGPPPPLDLDSPLTDVLEAPGGLRAVLGALEDWNPDVARSLRRTLRWTPGRSLRSPLLTVPLSVQRDIETRLAALAAHPSPCTAPPPAPQKAVRP